MPVLPLDEEEADAVLLGLCLLTRSGDPMMTEVAERMIERLAGLLPSAPPAPAQPVDLPDIAASSVAAAVEGQRKLRLSYTDRVGARSTRVVWPIGTVGNAGAPLLVAWCEMRAAFRHFRMDRIGCAALLDARAGAVRRVLLARYLAEVMRRNS